MFASYMKSFACNITRIGYVIEHSRLKPTKCVQFWNQIDAQEKSLLPFI